MLLVWLITSSTALNLPTITRRHFGLAAGGLCTTAFGAALPADADTIKAVVTDKVRLEFVQQVCH